MRRTLAVTAPALIGLVLGMVVSVATIAPTFAEDPAAPVHTLPTLPDQAASRALAVATRVLAGHPSNADPSASLALRDLRFALPRLTGADLRQAESLLARPTDGDADQFGDGYTVPAQKKCGSHICIHWVTSTTDKAPSLSWVNENLRQLNKVWALEVDTMGYRKPLGDGTKGGNSKLDVYLADVGAKGYYGYCANEKEVYGFTWSGYCVLDNDFDPAQFSGAPALNSLKVTAAHEFFHAVQYAYDAAEDRWFMESTATWMEERFADNVNDNLQYLPLGQVGKPQTSLDLWASGGFAQYGNWAWWEYLTERKGNGLVKAVWTKAAAYKGGADEYSTQALVSVLKNKGGFKQNFGLYASGNTVPAANYEEGSLWTTAAPMTSTYTLEATTNSTGSATLNLNHMSARNVKVVPGASLADPSWALRVVIDAPGSDSSPTVVVLVNMKDGSRSRQTITLSKSGTGKGVFTFDGTLVANVTVTMANASTRFSCWRRTNFSCSGSPRDQAKPFVYSATAFQP